MQKAIGIAKSNPFFKQAVEEILLDAERGNERLNFLRKQADKVVEEVNAKNKATWELVAAYCKENGIIDTLPPESHHFHYDRELDIIVLCDGNHQNTMPPMLAALFGK